MAHRKLRAIGFMVAVLAGLFAGGSAVAVPGDAEKLFNSVYGPKILEVRKTLSRDDDVALAKQMIDLAKQNAEEGELLVLLCDAAADLAKRHPSGYDTAIEAMELLMANVPAKRDAARDEIVLLLTRQSASRDEATRQHAGEKLVAVLVAAGDEKAAEKDFKPAAAFYRRAFALSRQKKIDGGEAVQAKLEWATACEKAMRKINLLEQRLLKDVNDTDAAKEIVERYVITLDDPKAALPFLDRAKDDTLSKIVKLAAGELEKAKAEDHLAIAEWYKQNAGSGYGTNPVVIGRVRHHATIYLNHPSADGLGKIKAQSMLNEVKNKLAYAPTLNGGTSSQATSKPATTKSELTQAALADWSVLCWQGNQWRSHPLTKMTMTKREDGGATFKNTTGIYKFAFLALTPPLKGDFSADLLLLRRTAAFLSGDGSDRTIWVNYKAPSDRPTRCVIERRNGKLTFTVDGKKLPTDSNNGASQSMRGRVVIRLNAGTEMAILNVDIKYEE